MISRFRRTATVLAALAVIGGAGAGVAGAATAEPAQAALGPVHTWFDPVCEWGGGFDWHYYHYCDDFYWHGSHFGEWQSFDRDHHGWDYRWHH